MYILHYLERFTMALAIFAFTGGISVACAVKKYYFTKSLENEIIIDNSDINNAIANSNKYDPVLEDITNYNKYDPVIDDIAEKFKSVEVKALESFYNRGVKLEETTITENDLL